MPKTKKSKSLKREELPDEDDLAPRPVTTSRLDAKKANPSNAPKAIEKDFPWPPAGAELQATYKVWELCKSRGVRLSELSEVSIHSFSKSLEWSQPDLERQVRLRIVRVERWPEDQAWWEVLTGAERILGLKHITTDFSIETRTISLGSPRKK